MLDNAVPSSSRAPAQHDTEYWNMPQKNRTHALGWTECAFAQLCMHHVRFVCRQCSPLLLNCQMPREHPNIPDVDFEDPQRQGDSV